MAFNTQPKQQSLGQTTGAKPKPEWVKKLIFGLAALTIVSAVSVLVTCNINQRNTIKQLNERNTTPQVEETAEEDTTPQVEETVKEDTTPSVSQPEVKSGTKKVEVELKIIETIQTVEETNKVESNKTTVKSVGNKKTVTESDDKQEDVGGDVYNVGGDVYNVDGDVYNIYMKDEQEKKVEPEEPVTKTPVEEETDTPEVQDSDGIELRVWNGNNKLPGRKKLTPVGKGAPRRIGINKKQSTISQNAVIALIDSRMNVHS